MFGQPLTFTLDITMNSSRSHLEKLQSLVGEFKNESGDVVIGKMIPEFAALIVTLVSELDAAQKTMLRLTWAVIALTVVMLLVGVAQFYVSAYPASKQAPSAKHVPHSDAPKNESKPIQGGNNK